MTDLPSSTVSKLKSLGIYQIAGGTVGMILILWGVLNIQQLPGILFLLILFILLFFAFSVYCGILCLKKHKIALKLSLINQILQVIGFVLFGVSFQYVAGVYLTLGLDLTHSFYFTFYAGISKFNFYLNNGTQQMTVDFNFIALGLIILIEKLRKQIKEKQEQLIL